MKHVDVVIGLGYGDEGKGAAVDWLCRGAERGQPNCGDFGPNYSGEPTAAVRFNGGPQAGHTVVTPDGRRHVFSHYGSGTFLDCATIFSRFMVINPIMFCKEGYELSKKISFVPEVFVDPNCKVTTPFDVFINQELERSRGITKHGSCGMGVGETEERHGRGFELWAFDLFGHADHLESHLLNIEKRWLPERLDELGINPDLSILKEAKERFICDAQLFSKNAILREDTEAMDGFDNIVMEGAQGMFLDAESEDFPHVTRSRTNSTNVIKLLSPTVTRCAPEIKIWYVTRSYLTRHGAGPLKNESGHITAVDETNKLNEFQGKLRCAPLDFKRMESEIYKDLFRWEAAYHDVDVRGIMSHMDQHLFGLSNEDNLALFEKALDSTMIATFDKPCWGLD